MRHHPVLLGEVRAALDLRPGEVVVDATFGAGGYTRAFLDDGARVIAIDRDESAIAMGRALEARSQGALTLIEGRFGALDEHLSARGVSHVDAVVFDLGVSSFQLDEPARGFSFRRDGPLDMRMGADGPSAADLVGTLPQRALADIFYRFGEERRSRAIAAAIVARRREVPLTRTGELADLVERTIGRSPKDASHPATRVFQALRIAVNRELEEIAFGLGAAERVLRPGGRLAVVSFHSLEDRLVKSFLAERMRAPAVSRHAPTLGAFAPSFAPITRRAVEPSAAEVARNPRARSARLRAARRLEAPARALDMAALGVPRLDDIVRGGRR